MHSIPVAMISDMLWRGRWTLPSTVLLVNAMPLLLLTALRSVGARDPNDPNLITIHIVLTQVNMWTLGVFLVSSQGPVARMYTLPVTTTTIVVWRLLPLVILAVAECIFSTLLLNVLFGLDWPLWGPALSLAMSLAVVQGILWYAEKSAWSVVFLTLLAAVYGGWMKSRYGALFSPVDHYWRQISAADLLIMLSLLGVAFVVGVAGVARNRRGDPPLSLGIIDWIGRMLTGTPGPEPTFRSPAAAQFWFEWRKKGWVMPGGAAFGLTLFLTIWVIFVRIPAELWEGTVVCGLLLSALGLVGGLIIGNNGKSDSNYDLTNFVATRPLTSISLADSILKTCGLSVLTAWLIWLVAHILVYLGLLAANGGPSELLPDKLSVWWYYPATLLGPWITITLVASVALTGRGHWFTAVGAVLFTAWIGWNLLAKFAVSLPVQAQVERGLTVALGMSCLVITIALYAAAWRYGLIRWPMVYVGGSIWAVLSAAMVFVMIQQQLGVLPLLFGVTLGGGILALAVAPFATTPLALAWNRVR
jgi:hypothetical protein